MPQSRTPPTTPITSTARLLSQALLSTIKNNITNSWTPSHEQTIHRFLQSSQLPITPSLLSSTIDPHLLHHHALAHGLFHWASHQPSFNHTPNTFHSLLKSLSVSHQPHSLLSLLSLSRSQRIPLPTPALHLAVSCLSRNHMPLEAFNLLFSQLPISSSDHSCRKSCSLLLGSLSIGGYTDHARRLFDVMLQREVPVGNVGFGVFLGRYCRRVELDDVLLVVGEVRRRGWEVDGSIAAALVADGLVREGRNEEAWQALEELRVRGFKPDFIAYRIVAEAFGSSGRVEDARVILRQKRKLGVAPRINDYREFIFELISERLVEVAKELGKAIVEGDFPIEDDVLNALVSASSRTDPGSAVAFCMYILEHDKCLDFRTLRNLSRNLCSNNKADEMWEIFRILMSKDYFADLEGYKLVVLSLCDGRKVREAYSVIRDMKRKGFSPDVLLYNILMEALCREDLLRPAKRLWDEMFKNGCYGDLQTYNILIRKFSEIDDAEEARRLFCNMLEKGVIPDSTTYTSVVSVLCRNNKLDGACEILGKLVEQNVVMADSVLSAVVLCLCKEGNFDASIKLVDGLPSSVDANVILIGSLSEAGHIGRAIEHLDWVKRNYPTHLQKVLNDLLVSLSTAPRIEYILQLLQALLKHGFVSEHDLWSDLLDGYS